MSHLVDGKIPANTVCPFKTKCEIASTNACHHTGIEHPVPFSCGAARGFEISLSVQLKINEVMKNGITINS